MLPKILRDVIIPIQREVGDPDWRDEYWELLCKEQPVLIEFLTMMKTRVSSEAILMGLTIYRMLDAQTEVDFLERLYNDPEN